MQDDTDAPRHASSFASSPRRHELATASSRRPVRSADAALLEEHREEDVAKMHMAIARKVEADAMKDEDQQRCPSAPAYIYIYIYIISIYIPAHTAADLQW